MTDKELAEEYEEKIDYIQVNDDGKKVYDSIDIQQAYIAGLQIGRQEKWHDLRKNPNDLPEDCAINQDGKRVLYDHINKVWRNDDADEYICDDPIAWCEIPKYPIVHSKENNEWHYIKDGVLPNVKFGRVDVTVAYVNAYENPYKMDCCFDGTDFIYWDDRKPIGWKKVDIFGKIYAWKYQEKLPEPPEENEE